MTRPGRSQHQARKRFGQNFLNDASVIASIIACIAPAADDNIVEIGPGLGALTSPLLTHVNLLQAIELDRDLIARLEALPDAARLTLHNSDVLKFDFSRLFDSRRKPLRIVGNLPYNISSPLLFHLLQFRSGVRDMHFMLQKEVVDRIAAGPGSKTYGRLSVMMQYYNEVDALLDVPPNAFTPAPKVQSAVLRLTPKSSELTSSVPFEALQTVVQLAFAARRKTLRNNLRSHLDQQQLEAAGFDPGARPETLDLPQFVALTTLWLRHQDSPPPGMQNA